MRIDGIWPRRNDFGMRFNGVNHQTNADFIRV